MLAVALATCVRGLSVTQNAVGKGFGCRPERNPQRCSWFLILSVTVQG